MIKVGIIGGTSFIAEKLITALNRPDVELYTWARTPVAGKFSVFNYPDQPLKVDDLLTLDYLFYLAGAGIQPKDNADHRLIFELNAFEPIRLINELQFKHYAGCFISFGSYFEIGAQKEERLFDEERLIFAENKPLNHYSIAKRLLSKFIYDIGSKVNFQLLHFILPNVYGAGENENRLLPYLIKQIKRNEPIHLTSGSQIRQYLHVNEICNLVVEIVIHRTKTSGIYNLGSPSIISVKELTAYVVECAKSMNLPVPEVHFNSIDKRDEAASFLALDDSLAKKTLGWQSPALVMGNISEYFN